MKHTGAEITIKLLEQQGIQTIAGIPGGSNLPLYDALSRSSITHILPRHEQAAGFIAQGIARTTGKPAVCFATSGPGATNLLTAIADAKLDSVPIIAITGQVPSSHIGTDAFQEVDTYGMSIPITKHNFLIKNAAELMHVIPQAFEIAQSGRPGPVLIDIPKDIQLQEFEFNEWPKAEKNEHKINVDIDKINTAGEIINNSKKPLIYFGGGIVTAGAEDLLYTLSATGNIPAVSTLMGLGAFPQDSSLYIGMLGMHGARHTNLILAEADLIIALGVRFDDRATGKVAKFCPGASILHIDIDASEIDKIKKSNYSIQGDLHDVLQQILSQISPNERTEWLELINNIKNENPKQNLKGTTAMHPLNLINLISSNSDDDTIITTDVGQHQMWAAQAYPLKKSRTFLTSGGLGTMGFGLPAAIGAALAFPNKKVICISGDGSILMNIQEFATLSELKLNITVFIMNNIQLGLVRQQQEMFYKANYVASEFISKTDFAAIGKAFGIKSFSLEQTDANPAITIKQAIAHKGPSIIDAYISGKENVIPIVPPGAGNDEMIGDEI